MNFSDLLNSFFGSDWMSSISNIAQIVGAAVLLILSKVSGSKLSKYTKNTNEIVANISGGIASATEVIDKLSDKIKKLEQVFDSVEGDIVKSITALQALGDIMATVFLEMKAISPETKVKITNSIVKLSELGITVASEAVPTNDDLVQEIIELKEQQEVVAQETEAKAVDTSNEAQLLYSDVNEILENE